ncbi:hypothetical protein [Rubrivirga sp. IMCC43871]|uniref:hypothetical protein n=1 Tax=Rubrivirga sp. IMCC43871 TaxID=3391575 RepID=UPI00398FC22D
MPDPRTPSARTAGTIAVAVGGVALVGYALLGASPESPDLPSGRLALAALLVIAGVAVRQEHGPSWLRFVAAGLSGLVVADLVIRLMGG